MQKKLIALAVSGLASSAAFAQTAVVMYGVVDAAYVNSSGQRSANDTRANFSGIQSGGLAASRIGFKGQESLGSDLKAVFLLEYQLAADTNSGVGSNTGGLYSRQSYVGLAGNSWGQIALGRQYAPAFEAWANNDPLLASDIASPLNIMNNAAGNTIVGGSGARISNSFSYTSPNWSGFSVKAIYGYGETILADRAENGVSVGANGLYGLGANYSNGPLNLDLLYQGRVVRSRPDGIEIGGLNHNDVKEWGIGGSYDFRVVKLFGTFQDQHDNNDRPNIPGASNKVWQVGAAVPVGNGAIRASYADLSWDKPAGHADATAWALGYTHSLSKRTTLYTTYTRVSNDKVGAGLGYGGAPAGGVGATAAYGEVNNTFAAGITHAF